MTMTNKDFITHDGFDLSALRAEPPRWFNGDPTTKDDAWKDGTDAWLDYRLHVLDAESDPDFHAQVLAQQEDQPRRIEFFMAFMAEERARDAARRGDNKPAWDLLDAGAITRDGFDGITKPQTRPAHRPRSSKAERRDKNWHFWMAARDVERIVDLWDSEYRDVLKTYRTKPHACYFAARRWFFGSCESELRVIQRKLEIATNKAPNDYRRLDTD